MVPIEVHILYDLARLEEKWLIGEFQSLGASVKAIRPSYIEVNGASINAVGVVRVASRHKVLPLAYLYDEVGLGSVNSFRSLLITHDKFTTLVTLAKAGVKIPYTLLVLEQGALKVKPPVIVKPTDGSWGRLVALAKTQREVDVLLRHSSGNMLVQEYVNKPNRDIRVTVVEDRVVAAIYRYSEDWRTNTARGGLAVRAEVDPELEDISVKAASATGVLYAGVDVVESEEGYMVLEVNGVPEFKNVQRVTGVNIAREVAEAVVRAFKT